MSDSGISFPSRGGRRLFDGASLAGWKSSENRDSWAVRDGALVAHGPAATLSLQSPLPIALGNGFVLEFEALTRPGARGAICMGSAAGTFDGLRVTVASPCSTTDDPGTWLQTGSIEGRSHIYKNSVPDNAWFRLRVTVAASRIQIQVNELLLADYCELRDKAAAAFGIALHWAGGDSEILFRRIELHEIVAQPSDDSEPPAQDEMDKKLRALTARGIPLLDLHAHLKGGLTLDELLKSSRRDGIQYGVAVNCGKGFPIDSDELALAFCAEMKARPVFAGMQAEGREWTTMFARRTAAAFDYIFTDSMTWTDNHGRRMRLWIPEEVGSIANPDDFMETLVARTVDLLEHEPLDIYVNPTFLPQVIADEAAQLWTEERIQRVVEAAARNQVAIELNDLYQLPSARFIRTAKAAGCRFTFGTNNTSPSDLRRCDYGLKMVEFCGLEARDFFVPATSRSKAIDRKPQVLHEEPEPGLPI